VIERLKTKGVWTGEWSNVRKDGTPFATYARITALELPGRRLWVCVQEDITEKRRVEVALRESEARFRNLADTAPVMIWMSDTQHHATYFNRPWLEFTGRSIEHELGFGWTEGVHPEDLQRAMSYFDARFRSREEFRMEFRLRRFDGDYRWVLDQGIPRYAADGTLLGYVGACIDITERRQFEAEREELLERERLARVEAEAANRSKSEFLAAVSHELRTPLNAIAGFTDLLQVGVHGDLTEAQENDIRRIQRNQQHLLSLIEQILNFARVEAGRLALDLRSVSVEGALADLDNMIGPQLESRGLQHAVSCRQPNLTVRADPEKLQQILLNLLSNAIKFTAPGGQIMIDCFAEGSQAILRIIDTGRGIPTDKLERIFEPFVQVDRSLMPDGQQGVGLGLAISRELARAMGGELTAQSEPGIGSTFTLCLPLSEEGPDGKALL
jgi:PAS domain S-box-containing protein